MTIKQLSIFLENKSGTLVKVLDLFKQSQIQLIAITIADTAEYGICRIICSEPTHAWEVLKKAGVAVALTDVFAIELDNKPGCGADAIKVFSDSGIEQAREVIALNNLKFVTEDQLDTWA